MKKPKPYSPGYNYSRILKGLAGFFRVTRLGGSRNQGCFSADAYEHNGLRVEDIFRWVVTVVEAL